MLLTYCFRYFCCLHPEQNFPQSWSSENLVVVANSGSDKASLVIHEIFFSVHSATYLLSHLCHEITDPSEVTLPVTDVSLMKFGALKVLSILSKGSFFPSYLSFLLHKAMKNHCQLPRILPIK